LADDTEHEGLPLRDELIHLMDQYWETIKSAWRGHDLGEIAYILEAIVEQPLDDWLSKKEKRDDHAS